MCASRYVETLLTPQHGVNEGRATHSASQITARQDDKTQAETKRAAGQQKGFCTRFGKIQQQLQTCSVIAAHNRDANIVFLCHGVTWGQIIEVASDQKERERKR